VKAAEKGASVMGERGNRTKLALLPCQRGEDGVRIKGKTSGKKNVWRLREQYPLSAREFIFELTSPLGAFQHGGEGAGREIGGGK